MCYFLDESADWAAALDKTTDRHSKPLFGLPLSVKECFKVKGHDFTVGLSRFIGRPAEEDAPFVAHLKELGAVPFCVTNVPQTMKSFACSNPIYGVTVHPTDNKVCLRFCIYVIVGHDAVLILFSGHREDRLVGRVR